MYVRGLAINGLTDLPRFSVGDLGRRVTVRGPSPSAAAIGDGLALGFAALSSVGLERLLMRWGLTPRGSEAAIEADPLPTQAAWSDTNLAKALCADPQKRRLGVHLDLELDPPLCADLRAISARDPRLGVALGGEAAPVLSIDVSAYFGASWDVLSISVQAVTLGGERFSAAASERAPWLTQLLIELGNRFVSHDESEQYGQQAMSAMTARAPGAFERFQAWQECLQESMGTVRPVHDAEQSVMLLADDRPLQRHGPMALRRVHMAASAFLYGADIMWIGEDAPWGERFIEGEGTALEQLWSVTEDGEVDPAAQPQPRTLLSFGSHEE
jgi:hypothetical protein